jgi:hypothetical protein
MHSVTRAPLTAAIFGALTMLLSGCIAYDAASTVVDVSTSVILTTGDIVTSPFDSGDSKKK